MIRVVFVDDEPKVLRGLQRMLDGADLDWETEFAESGRAALALLAERPFDVVVTDMRMPEMDGAALLSEVMRLYPHVVRIVLSGHSERELIIRSVGVAHRYLAKPCELEVLRTAVARAVTLRRVLADSTLRSLVSQLTIIPSAPDHYRYLLAEIQASDRSLKELGTIVGQDIGMTARILQIVNSAFFGLPRHVSDPVQAVCLLGLDVLKALVTSIHVFTEIPAECVRNLGLANLWNHSREVGAIAKMIASTNNCEREVCDHALMAGLLHDSGKLILAANQADRYLQVCHLADERGGSLLVAEREVFGTTHAEVGAYLLGLWGLPDPTVEAVAFHHRPADCEAIGITPLTAVHVADAIQHAAQSGNDHELPERLDIKYLQRLGLAERWPAWRDRCLAGASR